MMDINYIASFDVITDNTILALIMRTQSSARANLRRGQLLGALREGRSEIMCLPKMLFKTR